MCPSSSVSSDYCSSLCELCLWLYTEGGLGTSCPFTLSLSLTLVSGQQSAYLIFECSRQQGCFCILGNQEGGEDWSPLVVQD